MESKIYKLIESGLRENIKLALAISENPEKIVAKYEQVFAFIGNRNDWDRDDRLLYWDWLEDNIERIQLLITKEDLILVDCGLEQLPEEIFPLKNLKYLCLDGNKIETISEEILNLPNLIHLELSNNPIAYETSKIAKLQKLIPSCVIKTK